jgi:hypothetical protein
MQTVTTTRDGYGAPRCYLSIDSFGKRWAVTQGAQLVCCARTREDAIASAASFGFTPDPEIFWDARIDMWNDLRVDRWNDLSEALTEEPA